MQPLLGLGGRFGQCFAAGLLLDLELAGVDVGPVELADGLHQGGQFDVLVVAALAHDLHQGLLGERREGGIHGRAVVPHHLGKALGHFDALAQLLELVLVFLAVAPQGGTADAIAHVFQGFSHFGVAGEFALDQLLVQPRFDFRGQHLHGRHPPAAVVRGGHQQF